MMKKATTIFLFLLISNLYAIEDQVSSTIQCATHVPGLSSEEFVLLQDDIAKSWNHLLENGVLEITGTDKSIRPYFVAIQAIIEHVLASELNHTVTHLKGVIHTPMPATPLCTKGEISKDLVDPSIESDPARLFTVKARTTIIRDYLAKGGDLYIVYPQIGLAQRTPEQQKIYQKELVNYPNHLFDLPLDTDIIPIELIGATYLFQDQLGKPYMFAIKMTQAKDPQEMGCFGLWFGALDHPAIQERLRVVSTFLQQHSLSIF